MGTVILDGKKVAKNIESELNKKISKLEKKPKLAIFKINDDESTNVYISNKIKKCIELGIDYELFEFDRNISQDIIIDKINECNIDKDINGIIVELPVYDIYDEQIILNSIDEEKDVDGLTDNNLNKIINNKDCFVPCTVLAIEKLLNNYSIDIIKKRVVIINRSNLIGIPLFFRLLNVDSTVTICHSKSNNIEDICRNSDIIISAVGKKNFINENYVNDNSIIIDVGVSKDNNKIYGDVDFDSVNNKCKYISKVPGGVGPMTVISLMENIYKAYVIQKKKGDINEKDN